MPRQTNLISVNEVLKNSSNYNQYKTSGLPGYKAFLLSQAEKSRIREWDNSRPIKIFKAFLLFSDDHLYDLLEAKKIELKEDEFALTRILEESLNPYLSSYSLDQIKNLTSGDWKGFETLWEKPLKHLSKRFPEDFMKKIKPTWENLKNRKILKFLINAYKNDFFEPAKDLLQKAPNLKVSELFEDSESSNSKLYLQIFEMKSFEVAKILRERKTDLQNFFKSGVPRDLIYPLTFSVLRPRNLIKRKTTPFEGNLLYSEVHRIAMTGKTFNVSQILKIPSFINRNHLQEEIDFLSSYENLISYIHIFRFLNIDAEIQKKICLFLDLPKYSSRKIILFYILHGDFPENFDRNSIEERTKRILEFPEIVQHHLLSLYSTNNLADIISSEPLPFEKVFLDLISKIISGDLKTLLKIVSQYGIVLPYKNRFDRLNTRDEILAYLLRHFLVLFKKFFIHPETAIRDIDIVENYGVEPFFYTPDYFNIIFRLDQIFFWRINDFTKAQNERSPINFSEPSDLEGNDIPIGIGTKNKFYWITLSEVYDLFRTHGQLIVRSPFEGDENHLLELNSFLHPTRILEYPEFERYIERKLLSTNELYLKDIEEKEIRDKFIEFFDYLFITGLYMRRWAGPGNPYPLSKNKTLANNGFEQIVTERIYFLQTAIEEFKKKEEIWVYFSRFKYLATAFNGGWSLETLINQIFLGNYCIRVASKEFLSTAIVQYNSIEKSFTDPVTEKIVKVDDIDPIV